MKIYFEDGELCNICQLSFTPDFVLDASKGVSRNLSELDGIAEYHPDSIIYTNSILALDNRYAWNKELQLPEVYIRAGEHMTFTRIDNLTPRKLTEGHNLAKLYLSGEFGSIV